MNAIEIEEAISELAQQPFEPENFPYQFLEAFGNKATTIKRLRKGDTNKSDVEGGVLQRNNIHIAVCSQGAVTETLLQLKNSPATQKAKVKYVLATDGVEFQAENLQSNDAPVICKYPDFPERFGYFLSLAGISTVKPIRDNSFDIKATGKLNRLYIELLKTNPDWASEARRHDMNHFMARLIFCFFAEDTDIFVGEGLFTNTIEQMSDSSGSNVHVVMSEIFRAMDTPREQRAAGQFRPWADQFPYVNGGLFAGSTDTPVFSKIARSYLIHIGNLDWQKINPDIFGSMIQAVTDEEERGSLGMHYTSVPNILKVLNPLFLDDLRAKLAEAGDNTTKLLNLRKRMAKIRVFDPACGSGNFLVIAYKQMREIEHEINQRRSETHQKSVIPLTNFRGIELREFPSEIARLALIIAEYQCDVVYRGQKEALAEFLPLDAVNWIVCGNALRIDWLSVCPPTATSVSIKGDDLFAVSEKQSHIDFENEGGETYICGNPPYLGSKWQDKAQKADLEQIFAHRVKSWKSLDYVAGWFMKAADYGQHTPTVSAFVSTNSICQGQQVPILWPAIFATGHNINFAHTSFKWANLASHNAGVTVVIVAIGQDMPKERRLYSLDEDGQTIVQIAENINAYLVAADNISVTSQSNSNDDRATMQFGNHFYYATDLLFSRSEAERLLNQEPRVAKYIRNFYGSKEVITALPRRCFWIRDNESLTAMEFGVISSRAKNVAEARRKAIKDKAAQKLAGTPYRFRNQTEAQQHLLAMPAISSENRRFLPVDLLQGSAIVGHKCYALYDAPLWNMALIASRLHWVWIGTVCVRMRTDFSYSNTLGWNTFPVPKLTSEDKENLTRCAENILLAREAHFPATIADLYKPDAMPDNLRRAHAENDETLERIYIGRTFKNDTERLEELFKRYTKMTRDKNT